MAESLALIWDLIATDHASGTFRNVGREAEGASGSIGKLLGGFTAFAAGAAVAASIKAAADFQASMLLIQTQAGATSKEVADMSPKILALAGQVAQAPEALATSLYHVESTGLRGAQALDAVRIAAEGAKVGHADLEQTTNALTATIASGMLPATETYAQAMGQLNTIVGSGDMKMQDLNDALSTGLLVTVKQYGVNINDVGAALADFGDNNIRGADAATKLRMAVQAIESPAKGGAKALSEIGLTQHQLADDMSTGGLNKALTDLHQHLIDSGVQADQWGQILTDAFGKKAGSGVITLIGTFDRFKTKYEEVTKGADSFGNAWEATTKTAAFQASRLKDAVEATGIKIGTALLPYVTDLEKHVADFVNSQGFQDFLDTVGRDAVVAGHAIGDLVGWFQSLPGPVKDVTLALAGMAIADKIGLFSALTTGVEKLGASVAALPSKLTSGFTPFVLGIAGITTAVMASNAEIDTWAKGLEQGGQAARAATDQMDAAHTRSIADAHSLGDAWDIAKGAFADGLAQIEGYSSALDAASHKAQDMYNAMPLQQRVQQDVTTSQNDLNQAIDDYGSKSDAAKYQAWLLDKATQSLTINAQEQKIALDGVNGSLSSQIGLQEALARSGQNYDEAIYNTGKAIDSYTASMKLGKKHTDEQHQALDNVTQSFFNVLDAARRKADAETQGLPQSAIVNQEIVRQRDALDAVVKQLGFVPPALQGMYDSLNGPTAKALQALQTNVNNSGTAMTNVSNKDIRGSFIPALEDIATAAGTTVPQSITGGFIPSTDKLANQLTGPTNTAISSTMGWMGGWMNQMGVELPNKVYGPFVAATDQARLHMQLTGGDADTTGGQVQRLGQDIVGLPGFHNTVITADATQANATINDFLTRMNRDGFVGAQFNLTPLGSPAPSGGGLIGLPPVPHKAFGGAISGPGTGTSDSVLIAASNGEHMWTAAEVSAAGGHAAVEGMRRMVLAAGHGLAGGGPVPTSVSYPFDMGPAMKNSMGAALAAAAAAAAVAGGNSAIPGNRAANAAIVQQVAAVMGWGGGAEWDALVKLINRESGFNNVAQNPTSTAYGMFQFLDSTWGSYGGSKTSDPRLQSVYGTEYLAQRYGDPLKAWAHEVSAGWYEHGTPYVPRTGPAVLHQGERVVPASQNRPDYGRTAPLIGEVHVMDLTAFELKMQQIAFSHDSYGGVF